MNQTPLDAVFHAIDAINQQDPNIEQVDGSEQPKELIYGQRMTRQQQQFCPEASPELQIACRAQHIKRWASPRSDYPMDRAGYKKWRTELGRFHADLTVELMQQQGFDQTSQDRVHSLLQKKQLKRDPEAQALEDVICLVFLEYYLEPFAAKHSEEKLISIIQKTWNKMSDQGHSAALALDLPEAMGELVGKALNA
ncbi:MAG: hypothetical protein AseanaTS_16750 [Candidatus Pelagadaptatus aseana]|uniref:DUF4202 domain-containing protein n=1 Tax=Candidatus Pelagadaptatus aseana TaxID=3120508 RepID=UPI0039B2D5B9